MKFKFQSFFDVQTSASSVQVLQFSVGGAEVIKRCAHLFGAYKYFKLGKISVKMVPASTLPVDPLGLSYASTDPQTVDPRDQMNPGLVRITNGEDIYTDISTLTEAGQRNMYTAMMLDPRWSKFMLQAGFRRTAVPLYWQVGQLSQDKYPGATVNVPDVNGTNAAVCLGTTTVRQISNTASNHALSSQATWDTSSARGLFQVGHKGRLGYLPTDFYQPVVGTDGAFDIQSGANNVPEVKCITCVLPRAYKTVYYYRIFVTEEVYFAGLRAAPGPGVGQDIYFGADQFLFGVPTAIKPTTAEITLPAPLGLDNAQNNGGDLP